jgi:hypothetical protein
MAKYSDRYLRAAVGAISHWNDDDRRAAIEHFTQKGSELLEGSLRSAYVVFEALPASFDAVPSSLDRLVKLQNRWFAKLNALEPPYIGPWNATALFMVSLFAQPELAGQMTTMGPILPSGGPISRALNILYQDHLTERGAQALEDDVRLGGLGGAAADNGTMQDLIRGLNGTSMVDIHSGLYMLGTRDVRSETYFD